MTAQGDRQAAVRALTGTALTYEGDWHALFDQAAIALGTYNGRLLAWINLQLGTSYTEINGAMQAYATSLGAFNWSSLGAIWTPTQLGSSLLAWFDAARTDAITKDASTGTVSAWTDLKSGNTLVQATGSSQPIWTPTGFNSAAPVVTFDGNDDFLALASVWLPSGASACEMWSVVDQTAPGSNVTTRRAFAYGGATNNDCRYINRASTGTANTAGCSVGTGAASNAAAIATPAFDGRHVMRGVVDGANVQIFLDGTGSSTAAAVPATATTTTRIGVSTNGSGFWQGGIRSIVVTGALTTDQATQLSAYLTAQRG